MILLSGPVEQAAPEGVEVVRVVSAEEMFAVATSLFKKCHAAVMTAAVCDYRPARRLEHKLKKQNRIRSVRLMPTRDICARLGETKGDRLVIGFAMEDHDHKAHAEAKLKRKRCDAIVLNGIGNVGGDEAEIEILRADKGWSGRISGTKALAAGSVLDLVEDLRASRT